MNIVALIQARANSTRFPNKAYADLNGLTVIFRVVNQASKIEGISVTAVIWPQEYPHRDEGDVLGRYADAAREMKADAVVRITGDCPLFDPQIGTGLVKEFLTGRWDYVSNVWPRRTWPDGLDCEVFSNELLQRANEFTEDAYSREHVTPPIRKWARTFFNWELPVDWSHVRLTVDTKEDLEWLRIALNAPKSSFAAPSK